MGQVAIYRLRDPADVPADVMRNTQTHKKTLRTKQHPTDGFTFYSSGDDNVVTMTMHATMSSSDVETG
jgi:hypothetical protein